MDPIRFKKKTSHLDTRKCNHRNDKKIAAAAIYKKTNDQRIGRLINNFPTAAMEARRHCNCRFAERKQLSKFYRKEIFMEMKNSRQD